MAICVGAGTAWSTDLNPNVGRAQTTGAGPWTFEPKVLYAVGTVCPDLGYVDQAYDDEYWNFADPNEPTRTYLYMFYKFAKPSGYSSGDLKWRIWGNSGNETKIWRWNADTQAWVEIDSISGTNPSVQTYSSIPSSWFNADNDLYILATVQEGLYGHNIIADRIDIQW